MKSGLLDAKGQPVEAPDPVDSKNPCPNCGQEWSEHDQRKRRLSGGFGALHDVCGRCGHDFTARTL